MSSIQPPVPTGSVLSFSGFCRALGLAINPCCRARLYTSCGVGLARLSRTSVGLTTSIDVTLRNLPLFGGMPSFCTCSMFAFTAAASNGVPSVKVTPDRRVRVNAFGVDSHLVASPGTSLPESSVFTRKSYGAW